MFIPFSTLSTFLMYLFSILGILFLTYAYFKNNQIKKFQGKRFIDYYKEIPAYFLEYTEPKYKYRLLPIIFLGSHTLRHGTFSYEIDGEEYIYRGKILINIYSNNKSYQKEHRITLYQDPKTGKVFESLCNDEPEVRRFTINGIVMLVFAFFIFYLKYIH